ncbi:autotransporter assembly complex protein TamA [Psychrobacter sp. 1U1]|uniref:autotransporter assembly complex protein TamA n=1 Tax=Psychrobacter sp. 1U1 TaxID=3453576 RepID=UPI003F472680
MIRHQPLTQSRSYFTRSTLFTALASALVGFGVATPAFGADDVDTSSEASAKLSSLSKYNALMTDQETELDAALDALRLKKAVEQGVIDESVLEDYSEQTLKGESKNSLSTKPINSKTTDSDNIEKSSTSTRDDNLLEQAATVQQQGYQMMTPEQIDRELAAVEAKNNQDNTLGDNSQNSDGDFDKPVATLDSRDTPIGLDPSLDAASLPAPTNLDTLGRLESKNENAESDEIMSRPIEVSDAVSSNGVDSSQQSPVQTLAQQERDPVTGTDDTIADTKADASTGKLPIVDETIEQSGEQTEALNPDDYLPDYQVATETQAVTDSIVQASKPSSRARNSSNIVKRLYSRLFNGGAMALPHVETSVYLQQTDGSSAENTDDTQPKLIKADEDSQPINNIKAALDDTTVQSVADFTAALPRLRQTALDAAQAVGYYDVTLRLRQPTVDTIDVIIEKLGEPVRVDSRVVDIRGQGIEQPEFKTLETSMLPQEGDVFNHRVYKNSKAALEALSDTYGYFDQYWLNKSVDIILPDNTADVSLVYNTGDRYQFDDVVFFTYDEETGTLTTDPEKLPVETSLLKQMYDFEAGDPFYRPDITKLGNDLSATRYFNTVNVETILPPDDMSENSTLAFDNTPITADNNGVIDGDVDNAINDIDASNNDNIDDSIINANNTKAASGIADDSNDVDVSSTDIDRADNTTDSIETNNGATVDAIDVAPIEFEVDQETQDKLSAIKSKADRLSGLPNNRVLDEKTQEADNLLGKISDSISKVAKKIFPDDESILDEDFVPPTLAGRKTPVEVQESKKVPLYVFVSADKPRDAQVGIGYGTDTDVRATAKIDYNLINRKGYQAGVETEVSRINKNIGVYASRPWKHPLNDKLEGRLTYEEEVIDQGEGNFDLSTKTLKAGLARNIRRENGWNRSYSVRYRLDELETGVDDTELDDLPIRFTSSKPKQKALLFGYGVNKTDVDSVTNPTRGIRQYYGIEAGADKALSDTDLAIVSAGVSGVYSFGDDNKHQVLGSVNTGYIWADDFYEVPYKLRFFAGGDQSIRGYDYESLSPLENGYLTGGQILAVGSAEYNYEFIPGFRGAVFTDVGNAYDKDFETETKVGVGVGVRWASPVGVVRVDVAAGVTEDSVPVRLHFFIGSPL